jgi:hypothetical protein
MRICTGTPGLPVASRGRSQAQVLQAAAKCDLLLELATCLQALQPVEVPEGGPAPRPINTQRLLQALKAGLPHDQLEWGEQHDAAEALEVRPWLYCASGDARWQQLP